MRLLFPTGTGFGLRALVSLLLRMGLLLVPACLLLWGCWRVAGKPQTMLLCGASFQLLACSLSFLSRRQWQQPIGPSVIVLYLIALGWLWLASADRDDWWTHFAKAVLLMVPLAAFAVYILGASGATALRRSQVLARCLAERKEWPEDLAACRALPEVKALRDALHLDATPALALLDHPLLPVRVAALAALEYRKSWNPGQVDLIVHLARTAEEPALRAGAVTVLANVDDRVLIETLAEYLRDPAYEVRRAATEALLWDSEHRWEWIHHLVRQALSDPQFQDDGALRYEGQLLTGEAVADLHSWAAEKGILGQRAALTLGVHYGRVLAEKPAPGLTERLRDWVADPLTPAVLRIELARLVHKHGTRDFELYGKLLDGSNPAPLRLLAAEVLLDEGPHEGAFAALRNLARSPNREIALATADVIQRRLGIDLGLALDQPLPAVHTRRAADVTRRVQLWATPPGEVRLTSLGGW